jgi:hypothetical protein
MSTTRERHLYVAWRRPEGLIVPVGRLTQRSEPDGSTDFRFVYLKGAERNEEFPGLPGLLDRYQVHESHTLFPVFANRLMPRERADYGSYVEQLDLTVEADPFEVLGRSEGVRATDRIEVFPAAERADDGRLCTLFFARGIRHLEGASESVDGLRQGDELTLVPEPDNEVNPRAMLLNTRTGAGVGWAPDYLLDLLHELGDLNEEPPAITVEHVNPATVAPHLRLLCRLAAPWPAGYEPFTGPDFQPLT